MTNGTATSSTGRTYWQSFEHLANSPEIAETIDKEFAGYDPQQMRALSRRRFLKYVAASMALAGLGTAGCRRWPKEVVAPYAHKPVGQTPGLPEYYATSWEVGGVGSGLLAESYDGRPIKLEGNPSHPANVTRSGRWGATDLYTQGQPLSLYDPDRSRNVVDRTGRVGVPHDVQWFKNNVVPQLQQANGGSMAVLCEATASPTVERLKGELQAAKAGVEWYTWEPLVPNLAANDGTRLRPIYSLDKALVVVSLDDDYLGMHPASVRYNADWSALRASADVHENGHDARMSRCYTAECRYSLTGASGDVRLPVKPSRLKAIATALAAAVGVQGAAADRLSENEAAFVERAAADLKANPNAGLVAFGSHLPADLQGLAMQINDAIGAVGNTIQYVEDPTVTGGSIIDLARRMAAGEIETLLILGGNPVYDAPADLNFGQLLGRVATSVHLSLYQNDETSLLTTYHVPRAHFLEHWGDTRGWDGTVAPIQPLILPLFNGLSPIEMLALVAGLETTDGMTLVRETLAPMIGASDPGAGMDKAFRKVLHEGIVPGTRLEPVDAPAPAEAQADPVTGAGGFEITFAGDSSIYDGRFANNGWLQECPEPLTKLTWDNAALMNLADADELGVRTRDMIRLTVNGRMLELPVYVMPGQPRGVIGLTLGYGHQVGGSLAVVSEDSGGGFDTYRLRTSDHLFFAGGATVEKQGQRYLLAMTQNHHLIDDVGFAGREKRTGDKGEPGLIIRESTFAEHAYFASHDGHNGHNGGGGHHNAHPAHKDQHGAISLQIFQPPSEFNTPHAWGMTIDMNTCTGCSACVVACQSENNIPVVGKESVANNREMHWLRIDRYFKSTGDDVTEKKRDENPDVAWQPMMCVHCENAPCESVCPVAATVHDTEGLNTMIYNRCIGTRYCSNNCPYKVRRFNYLDWHYKDPRGSTLSATYVGMPDQQQNDGVDAIKRMVFNPDVTVRMRGVMEKCTYCTQRIKAHTISRKNQYRGGERDRETIDDGDILTACQQACPTESIIFGNLNDKAARVTRQQQSPRAYGVLDELNTRPRTRYLAKLRNRDEVREEGQAAPDEAHSEEPAAH